MLKLITLIMDDDTNRFENLQSGLTTKFSDRRPGTCSGCNSRVETLPNHPTAQRDGGSLQRSG